MSFSLPAELESALWRAAGELLPADALVARTLDQAIHARTRRYTSERERLHAPLAGAARDRDLAARALFFGVADAAKVAIPVAELAGRGLLPAAAPLRVLDAGAGALAMTLGLAAALPGRAIDVTAIDTDDRALALGARAVELAAAAASPPAPSVTVATRRVDLAAAAPALPDGPFELILAGTVLNELPEPARLPLVRSLVARLAPGGALIVLEPALRATARALHALRDAMLAAGVAHVFAPCTRAAAPCPALADADDWCHEDRPFSPPPRLAELARRTGLRQHGLKFAYLTLRRADAARAPLVVAPPGRVALRVVSDDVSQKGATERFVCGAHGRTRLRLLRRARGPALDALAESSRGDVLVVDDPLAPTTIDLVIPTRAPTS